MGAERTMWVEVETLIRVWRESYGVTSADAIENVKVKFDERVTGNVRYEEDEAE